MSVSFPPPVGPSGPGFAPPPPSSPPFPEAPLDNFSSSSSAERLSNISLTSAAVPRLPLATYYGTVSQAIAKQKAQEVENKLKDAQILINIWRFFEERATFAIILLNGVFKYETLQATLFSLGIETKKSDLNSSIQNFNTTYGSQDSARLEALNDRIDAFNTAEEDYKTALANYNASLTDYDTALDNYNQAVSTYEEALEAYQNGEITEAELLAAQQTFENDKGIYDTAKDSLNDQKILLDNAVASLALAKGNLDSERTTYNNYVLDRQTALANLNTQISLWNITIDVARDLLIQMNEIRDVFGLPLLELPEKMELAENLSLFNYPAGSTALTQDVQTTIGAINLAIGLQSPPFGLNGDIAEANARIDEINSPSLNSIPYEDPLETLTLVTLYGPLSLAVPVDIPEEVTYTPPPEEHLTAPDASLQLEALQTTGKGILRERRFQETLEEDIVRPFERRTLLGGAGASTQGTALVSAAGNSLRSPLLERQLSRQAFEAFFNFYGVPIGSALVDQIKNVYGNVLNFTGLTSAAIASEILGDAAVSGENGQKALDTAVAFGNLIQMHTFLTSGQLNLTLAFLIDKDPALTDLSPERKTVLIENLVAYLGNMALKDALAQIAETTELPGLIPQLLASIFDEQQASLISDQQPLLQAVLLSEQLSNIFLLSIQTTEQIAREAIAKEVREDRLDYLLNQLATAPLRSETNREKAILEALEKAENLFKQERQRIQQAKEDAFKEAIVRAFILHDLDPSRFLVDANRIELSSKEAAQKSLMKYGLSREESAEIGAVGWLAYNSKNSASNPLGSFLLERVGGSTELSGLLKAKITQIFSPVIGERKAREVAEDYGSLIYTAPNSLLNLMKGNEKQALQIAHFKEDTRLFEDYRLATEAYRNPTTSKQSPLHLGKTLLLTGLAGGISFAGTTSGDTVLGPLGNRNKHATNYPGILG